MVQSLTESNKDNVNNYINGQRINDNIANSYLVTGPNNQKIKIHVKIIKIKGEGSLIMNYFVNFENGF
jgi:hypothetical protein